MVGRGRGLHSKEVAFVLLTQWPRVRFSPFSETYLDGDEIYLKYYKTVL